MAITSNTLRQAQDRNIEGAAARSNTAYPLAGVVQPVGNGGGSGLVDKAQQIDARGLAASLVAWRWASSKP